MFVYFIVVSDFKLLKVPLNIKDDYFMVIILF